MAFSLTTFLKGLLIKQEGTLTPAAIEVLPAGTASTTTTLTSSQTANRTITFPDETGTLPVIPVTILNGGTGQTTQTAGFDALSPTTTKGDIIVHDGTNNLRHGIGTDGFVLTADSTAPDGVDWKTPAAFSGILPIANGGTNSSAALNNNRVMRSSGGAIIESPLIVASRALVSDTNGIPTAANPTTTEINYVSGVTSAIQTQVDAKIPKTLTTTTGDMIYASSANNPARLAVGSANTVIKSSGGIPTWGLVQGANIDVGTVTGTNIASTTILNGNIASTTIDVSKLAPQNLSLISSVSASAVTTGLVDVSGSILYNYQLSGRKTKVRMQRNSTIGAVATAAVSSDGGYLHMYDTVGPTRKMTWWIKGEVNSLEWTDVSTTMGTGRTFYFRIQTDGASGTFINVNSADFIITQE